MMDKMICEKCCGLMNVISKESLDHGYRKEYECDCGEFYTVTVSHASEAGKKNRKVAASRCDENCKIDCREDHKVERIPSDDECCKADAPPRVRWIVSIDGIHTDTAKILENNLNDPKNNKKYYVFTRPVTVQKVED